MLYFNMYFNNNEPILTSMLAAGILQDTFGRRLEATSTAHGRNSSVFLALEFLSQNTNTRMRIRNVRTYAYINKI